MCLSGPGIAQECVVTGENGKASFSTDLREGSHTITEQPREGWRQESSEGCSFTVNYPADQSHTFNCTFHNEQLGRIIIEKLTDPPTEEPSFAFSLMGGPSDLDQSFSLNDGDSHNSGWVQAGSGYAAAETVPAGWDQSWASCDNESPVGNINVDPGDTVTCSFVNTKRGAIVIKKVTDPEEAAQSFEFTLQGGTSELDEEFALSGGQSREFKFVEPGDGYAASESVPAGWDQTSASCDDESPVGHIDVSPGEIVTCTFTNTQRGQIVIKKVTDPAGAAQSFGFTLVGGPSAVDQSFSLVGGGSHESGFVKPGSGYSARENVPSDWTQTSATCDDGSDPSEIDVSPNELVTCTFTNTAKPNGISLDKKVNGGDHASVGEALLGHAGDPLTYTIVITNTGQVPLTLTALSDSLYTGFAAACPQGVGSVLAVGASFTCTYQVSAADDAHNVAAVDAVDRLNRPVTDADGTFVDIIHPAISIVKTANPESVSVSGPVTYTYVVTNTGDTPLFGVLVTDDILGAIGRIGELAVGESVPMAKVVDVDASSPPKNIGTVVGNDQLGQTVTASDDAVITVVLGAVLAQPELPRTGAPLGAQTRAALALLEVGVVLLLAGRRRLGRRAV
jgi:archaellum component FlaG (FlaF/FlaG flagellin family)